jgi:hypothetical protein
MTGVGRRGRDFGPRHGPAEAAKCVPGRGVHRPGRCLREPHGVWRFGAEEASGRQNSTGFPAKYPGDAPWKCGARTRSSLPTGRLASKQSSRPPHRSGRRYRRSASICTDTDVVRPKPTSKPSGVPHSTTKARPVWPRLRRSRNSARTPLSWPPGLPRA